MSNRQPETSSHSPRVTRRSVLRVTGGTVIGLTAGAGTAAGQSSPGFDGWFAETDNYEGIVDETGSSSVELSVGPPDAPGGPFVFGPAAVRVDPGTTVTWEWTGEGGNHDVVASDGTFESKLTDEAGATFEHTFDESGIYRYYCTPHKALGMRGVVVVGDVELGGSDAGFTLPGDEFDQTFLFVLFGIAGLSTVVALTPDVPPAVRWAGRLLGRFGYGIHRRTGFRNRPVAATVVGWLSFATVLSAIGIALVGLWVVGAGPIGFVIGLGVLALLATLFVSSRVGVSILPSPAGGRVSPTHGSPGRYSASTVRGSSAVVGRFDLARAIPVVRGWIVIALLLAIGAGGSAVLWFAGGGAVGLLVGLLIVGALGAWYAVSRTW